MRNTPLILSIICLLAVSCGPSDHRQADQQNSAQQPASAPGENSGASGDAAQGDDSNHDSEAAEEKARQKAVDELEDQTYEDVMGSSECTEDCSGHNAGWEWAKKKDIIDADECSGDSDSFIAGCKAYADEVERRTTEYEGGQDDSPH